jgi:hypothetical protein
MIKDTLMCLHTFLGFLTKSTGEVFVNSFFRSVYTVFAIPESYHMSFSVVLSLKIMIRDLNCNSS